MQGMSAAGYDQLWQTGWGDANKRGPFHRHLRRLIMSLIRPLNFKSVLDVGCGQGVLLDELRAEFPQIAVNGTEISELGLEVARKTLPDGRFWSLDAAKECLPEQFDLVICSEVLEHIPDDVSAIKHLAQMTGRYLIISTPQGRMRRFEPEMVGHVRNYAHGELVRKLEQSGMRVLKVIEWGFPFYSPIYRDVLELTNAQGTRGELGVVRRAISVAMYYLFLLNSWKRGDEIVVLAEPATPRARG